MPPKSARVSSGGVSAPAKSAAKAGAAASQPSRRRAPTPPPMPQEEEEEEDKEEEEDQEQDEDEDEDGEDEGEGEQDADDDAEQAAEDEADAVDKEEADAAEATGDADEYGEDDDALNDEGDPDDDRLGDEAEGEDSGAGKGAGSEKQRTSKSKHALAATDDYAAALAQRGVVYVSRIPPFMKAAKLRWLLEKLLPKHKKRARIGRIFLTPEDASAARRRKKMGGNSGSKFVDGWVEFESKKIARWLAESYNNKPMGGPKRSRYAEDLWNLQYLSGFKWHHLTEKIAYEKQIRSTRIREEMSQAKRESEYYLQQVERSRKAERMAEKKKRKADGDADDAKGHKKPMHVRNFHQRSLLDKPKPAVPK